MIKIIAPNNEIHNKIAKQKNIEIFCDGINARINGVYCNDCLIDIADRENKSLTRFDEYLGNFYGYQYTSNHKINFISYNAPNPYYILLRSKNELS